MTEPVPAMQHAPPAARRRPSAADLHVVVDVGGERLAAPVSRVRELVTLGATAHVPGAPEWLRGVQSIRGRLIPIVDTRRRLGLPPGPDLGGRECVVVVQLPDDARHTLRGFTVDAVVDVTTLDAAETGRAAPAPSLRFIRSLASVRGRATALLDLEALLRDPSHASAPAGAVELP